MDATAQNMRLETRFAVQGDKTRFQGAFPTKALFHNANAGVGDEPEAGYDDQDQETQKGKCGQFKKKCHVFSFDASMHQFIYGNSGLGVASSIPHPSMNFVGDYSIQRKQMS